MKLIWVSIILLFLGSGSQEQTVEVYRVEKDGIVELHARNRNIYPVTLELDADLVNMKSSKKLPLSDVIKGTSNKLITILTPVKKDQKWEFQSSYKYYMGSIFAQHNDSYEYRLPYRVGSEHKVTQGYHGTFSHKGRITYSLDFDMDEGTEVYAARSGVVVEVVEQYDEGGGFESLMDKANYITILHNDGTLADYSHLKQNGSIVTVGQRIRVGTLIGYSGDTGYATGPHLHFNVKKANNDGGFITLPVKFRTRKGVEMLQQGQSYIAK